MTVKFQDYVEVLQKGDQVYVAGAWYDVNRPPTVDFVPIKEGKKAVRMVDREKIIGVKFRRPTGELVHWDKIF